MSGGTNSKSSSDQFDALIELLATDDAVDDSNFHIVPEGAASTGLRDANGKLDYTKIRSLFQQRQTSKNTEHVSSSDPSFDPDPEIKLPEVIAHVAGTRLSESLMQSALDRSRRAHGFGGHISPCQATLGRVKRNRNGSRGSIPDLDAQAVLIPQDSEDSVVHNLEDALSKAYEEIAELRRQVLQLETQAAELFKPNSPEGKLFKSQATVVCCSKIPIDKIQTRVTFVGTYQNPRARP
ncbi:hypothetical protein EDB92DRAFT_1894795 [Lactarius akahatsu]|uniref:Uncharacterized protein n=1 Tax=Lactarius akahatsu TaxID=416441 RepID=A0AAD4Q6H9_9AGAM|nr:hypothetical protein EDB92DRAFT_1894795 [Lactarius akahatsu]